MTQTTNYRNAPTTALPFATVGSMFSAEPTDRESACSQGGLFAAHFAQYLIDNPFWAGSNILIRIIEDMHKRPDLEGQVVGFCAMVEEIIFQSCRSGQPFDVYLGTERRRQSILASRRAESDIDDDFDEADVFSALSKENAA